MLVSIVVMIVLYFAFPSISDLEGKIVLDNSNPIILGIMGLSVFLTLISIMKFKKRQQQFVLNRLTIIFNFVLLGVFVYRSLTISGGTFVSEKGIGMLLPVISIVFLVLANKAIKRDEDLVKSVDRLR